MEKTEAPIPYEEHHDILEVDDISIDDTDVKVRNRTVLERWALLRNVVRAARLFRNMEISHTRLGSILADVARIPTDEGYRKRKNENKRNSAFDEAVRDHR
jgi:hypothetical protein